VLAQQGAECWQDQSRDCCTGHYIEHKISVGYVTGCEILACIGDQGAVEPEQTGLNHAYVGFEQEGGQCTDDGPEQAGRAVDPGIIKIPPRITAPEIGLSWNTT
jgi:hypothetical protein